MLNKNYLFLEKINRLFFCSFFLASLAVLQAASSPQGPALRSSSTVSGHIEPSSSASQLKALKGSATSPIGMALAASSGQYVSAPTSKSDRKKVYRATVTEDFVESDSEKKTKISRPSEDDSEKEATDSCCCTKLVRYLEARERRRDVASDLGTAGTRYLKRGLGRYRDAEENHQKGLWDLTENVPVEASSPSIPEEEAWLLSPNQGESLSKNLQVWCDRARWKLLWKASCDYPVQADALFSGDFPDAVVSLIDAYKDAELPLRADIYPKQHLIVISLF